MKNPDFEIAGHIIKPGTRHSFELPVPDLYVHSNLSIPVHVIHGRKPGPVLFISAAVHGDEIVGVEIIRRLMVSKQIRSIKGTLILVPVVNIFGFLNQSRYLPDRRDLNRSFPGSERGSIAGRLANLFLTQIVAHCSHGIDLHTAAINRENLPQVRAVTTDEEVANMATSFGLPVIINSELLDGSLRAAASDLDVKIIVYEAGEALRFDENAIRAGLNGVVRVMRSLTMLRKSGKQTANVKDPSISKGSRWVRAPQSGIHRSITRLGVNVKRGDILGYVSSPLGENELPIEAIMDGIIVGRATNPLVTEGEAVFHVATFEMSDDEVAERIDQIEQVLESTEIEIVNEEPPIV